MRKIILPLMLIGIISFSCQNKSKETTNDVKKEEMKDSTKMTWEDLYQKIDPSQIPDNVIKLIGKEWMLITAGNESSYNSMTASWGALGNIWNKPISLITVRDTRYTYQFLEKNDSYTLTFFPEDYRNALTIMGTKSGRDTDKVKEAGLTPVTTPSGLIAFSEARMILECKKVYAEPLKKEAFIDTQLFDEVYNKAETSIHTMYIGEITNVWIKK